jgi:septal ring factor EnvC (AmiA/AmiB activator)
MTSESTTRWPLLEERTPFVAAPAPGRSSRRRLPRSAWLLTALAFLCGGLVSAAAFSIGWRHQAQRDTAARAALATATAHVNRLSASLATARETIAQERQVEAEASAAMRATSRAAASLATQATSAGRAADTVSGDAADIGATASRISRELQTLLTYLTTTPSSQIDSGYIASQAGYLTRQLTALESSGAAVGKSVTSLKTTLRKLARSAATLH